MIKIGIDFSLNSPAVCIEDDIQIKFVSFFNTDGYDWNKDPNLKKFYTHNKISNLVELKPYARHKNIKGRTYAQEQSEKMDDAEQLCNYISDTINQYTKSDVMISLEGFAYASNGSAFIDLILFNSFLRKNIIEKFGADKLEIISPATAKKLAGKGNADKEFMINAFINNVLIDDKLIDTKLHKYMLNSELDMKHIKPIDDIVDSYFIMKSQNDRNSRI